jgi:hypothetical protein
LAIQRVPEGESEARDDHWSMTQRSSTHSRTRSVVAPSDAAKVYVSVKRAESEPSQRAGIPRQDADRKALSLPALPAWAASLASRARITHPPCAALSSAGEKHVAFSPPLPAVTSRTSSANAPARVVRYATA